MFSSLPRQWLSWSHACGRSGAQRGFDLAWPAVSAGTCGFHKLTTYQNMCLQQSREFTSHLSLDCWLADGGCSWGSVGLGEDLLQDKCWNHQKMGRWCFQFSVHYLWMELLTAKYFSRCNDPLQCLLSQSRGSSPASSGPLLHTLLTAQCTLVRSLV